MGRFPMDKGKVPQAFWRALEHLELSPSTVLRQAGLPSTLHLNPHELITTEQHFGIWKAIEALTTDTGFGIKLIEAINLIGHQPAFLAACYAADYRDGIYRVQGFKDLGSCERFHIEERDGEFSIFKEWPYAAEPEPALSVEMTFACLIDLGRKGTGHHLTPIRVDFERPGPNCDVHRTYFGCPIRYGAPRNMLVMRSTDLNRPFTDNNPEFLDMLTPALKATFTEVGPGSTIGEQVKAVLERNLASGRLEVACVARDLGMSERTLQRRITEEGITFRTLLTEVRNELSLQLLSDSSIEMDEVARRLGYQNTSSFYRAFREWEGVTPGRWRALRAT